MKKLTNPEKQKLIQMTEALDNKEKEVVLLTLLRVNYEKEFCDLRLITPKILEEYKLKE